MEKFIVALGFSLLLNMGARAGEISGNTCDIQLDYESFFESGHYDQRVALGQKNYQLLQADYLIPNKLKLIAPSKDNGLFQIVFVTKLGDCKEPDACSFRLLWEGAFGEIPQCTLKGTAEPQFVADTLDNDDGCDSP